MSQPMRSSRIVVILGLPFVLVAIVALLSTPSLALDEPVGAWLFEEPGGSVAQDSSTAGNDGVIFGATRGPGVMGGGLDFSGTTDFVGIPGATGCPAALAALPFGSISVWFRLDPLPPTSSLRPVFYLGNGQVSPNDSALVIEAGHGYPGGSKLYFTYYQDGATPLCFDSGYHLETETWYHFVGVVGPDFNTGYLNGVEMVDRHYNVGDPSTSHFLSDVTDPSVFWIGKGYAKQLEDMKYFDGTIDEVRVYDVPLTAQDVAELYGAPSLGQFIRGDANGDRSFDIGDPVSVLNHLFVGETIGCLDAADANDDGMVDIGDAVFALSTLFAAGADPSAPFPECGADPTADALDCWPGTDCP
ncbi:MAG: hypothetical protein KDC38_09945 [Planctomycetes bacterium]|nr:hypothetical protein [Planctomycetota bacterium]